MNHVGDGDDKIGGLADLIKKNQEGMEKFARLYADPDSRPGEMSDEEVAYHFVVYASMFFRYAVAAGELENDELENYDHDQIEKQIRDPKRLIIAAATWASGNDCAEEANFLLTGESVDPNDRQDVERWLLLLDELYVFLVGLYTLSEALQLHDDAEVVAATAKTKAVFDELETVLRENPVECALAAGPLIALREQVQLPIQPRQWWLRSAKEWAQVVESQLTRNN